MLMETHIMVTGSKTKNKDMALTLTQMEHHTMENGMQTINMDKASKIGQMVQYTLGLTKMVSKMERGLSNRLMVVNIKDNSQRIASLVMVFTNGLMAESTKETGMLIRCMDKESLHMSMAKYTLEILKTMPETALENLFLTTGELMKACGLMGNSMVRGNCLKQMGL